MPRCLLLTRPQARERSWMDHTSIINRMRHTPAAVRALVAHLPLADVRFKPPSGAWSILEIVNHLADDDRDDFRLRLKSTLENARAPWPKNDPEAWARDRRYYDQDLAESLARFERERRTSLAWLDSLHNIDWTTAYHHPTHG